jgi:plastocyanin
MVVGLLCAIVVPARAAPPIDVTIKNRTYNPSTIQIPLGGNVRWTNEDTGILTSTSHTVTDDNGAFSSGTIPPGGNFHFRFTKAGTYTYHCEIHPTMHGMVIVTGGTSPSTTASASPKPTKTANPSPTATPTRSHRPSPKATPRASAVAEAAPDQTGDPSSAGSIISVAIVAISVLVGLGYVVYLRYLRASP